MSMGLQCLDCHVSRTDSGHANTAWEMVYPDEAKCMQCHASIKTDSPAIKKLASYFREKQPVPWVPVYAVPDFVFFSHKVHVRKAKLDCAACHGPVTERDVIVRERPTSMAACMDCHHQRRAPNRCDTCHNPNP